MSDIERGTPCSVKVALAIEDLSNGRIRAGSINADVAAVEARLIGGHDGNIVADDPDNMGSIIASDGAASPGKSGDFTAPAVTA